MCLSMMQFDRVHRAFGDPSDTLVHGYHQFSCINPWECTKVWSAVMRKLESVPQIWGLGMKGRSMSLKDMLFLGVHWASGYPSDTVVHGYHQFEGDIPWECTKVWSAVMRKLGSVPQVWGLGMKRRSISLKEMLLVGVLRASGFPFDNLVHGYHHFSCIIPWECTKFEALWWGNWKVCLKFEDRGWRVGPYPWRRCCLLVPIERLPAHPTPLFTGTISFHTFSWGCTKLWSVLMSKPATVPQIW